jgi:hypothetical protein
MDGQDRQDKEEMGPVGMNEVYLPQMQVAGVMWGAGDTYHRPDIRKAAGVVWWYDWSPAPGGDGIPMLYSGASIGAALQGDATWLMGFNEPDISGQANMTPDEAARAWSYVESTYAGRKLVSPAVMDLRWLMNWRAAYWSAYGRAPRVDAIGVHWYYQADGDPLRSLQKQIEQAEALAGEWGVGEIWLSEFSLYPCWGHDVPTFMRQAFAWLKTRPLVKRAGWFQTFWYNDGRENERDWAPPQECYSGLGLADGSLTEIGRAFAEQAQAESWDRRADVNQDGRVDILDMVIVGANFGQPRITAEDAKNAKEDES